MQALIRRARSLDVDVRLVVGQKDYYQSFSTDLASIPLFRARGDPHMPHNHPHESAWSVYTFLSEPSSVAAQPFIFRTAGRPSISKYAFHKLN